MGQGEQLFEFRDAAPVRAGHRAFVGHREETERQRPAAHTDNGDVAKVRGDGAGKSQRVVVAADVEHQLGAAAAGDRPDLRRGVGASNHRVIGSEFCGDREGRFALVDGDDGGRRKDLQELHGKMSEAAGPDHHDM